MKEKVIIVGHGGSGKDYLVNYLIEKKFKKSISYTTRPPRKGEINGDTYFFISLEQFKELIDQNFWHEYNVFVNDWYYGASKKDFKQSNLFIKEPNGVSLLTKEEREKCYVIYININEDIRKNRLSDRKDADSVQRRIEGDNKDFKNFIDYDLEITNPYFNCESILYKIIRETNIKQLSHTVVKEMLKYNVYLKYTEDNKDYLSFENFCDKILSNKEFSTMYDNMLNTEKALYLQT